MSHHTSKNDLPFCRNCHYPQAQNDKFCANCGQKSTDGKASMHDLLHEFVHTWLHVDGKFFSTAAHLFVPGKLTVEFFKGRHKRYAHPIQLFFLLTVASVAASTWLFKDNSTVLKAKSEAAKSVAISKQYNTELRLVVDSATQLRPQLRAWADSVMRRTDTIFSTKVDEKVKKAEANMSDKYNAQAGFFAGYEMGQKMDSKKSDSTKKFSDQSDRSLVKISTTEDTSRAGTMQLSGLKIPKNDLLLLSDEELNEKYQLNTSLKRKIIITAAAHILQRGGDFIGFLMSKMIWVTIFMIPILGLILLLLYRRQQRFYVEHIVFLLHWFAFSAVTTIFSAVLSKYQFKNLSMIVGYALPYVYLLFAISVFYEQEGGKMFLKFLLFLLSYFFIMLLFVALGLVIAAILF